jgi:hypothetical protein
MGTNGIVHSPSADKETLVPEKSRRRGAPPKKRNIRTCEPVQSGSVCVKVASAGPPGDGTCAHLNVGRHRLGTVAGFSAE